MAPSTNLGQGILLSLGVSVAVCSSGGGGTGASQSAEQCAAYRYKIANPTLAADIVVYGLDAGSIVADSAAMWDADAGVVRVFHEVRAIPGSSVVDADSRTYAGVYASYSPTGRNLTATKRNIFSGRPTGETESPGHPKLLDMGAASRIYFREQNMNVLSATTTNWGRTWTRDTGVRVSMSQINAAFGADAGSTRYMDSDWSGLSVGGVYRYTDGTGSSYYRKYLSNNDSAADADSDIFSAISTNGTDFTLESGVRIGDTVAASKSADDALRPTVLPRELAGCVSLIYQVQRCDGGAQCLKYATSADYGTTFGSSHELGDGTRTVTAGVKGVGGISGPSVVTAGDAGVWLLYTDSADNTVGAYITVWDLLAVE